MRLLKDKLYIGFSMGENDFDSVVKTSCDVFEDAYNEAERTNASGDDLLSATTHFLVTFLVVSNSAGKREFYLRARDLIRDELGSINKWLPELFDISEDKALSFLIDDEQNHNGEIAKRILQKQVDKYTELGIVDNSDAVSH